MQDPDLRGAMPVRGVWKKRTADGRLEGEDEDSGP